MRQSDFTMPPPFWIALALQLALFDQRFDARGDEFVVRFCPGHAYLARRIEDNPRHLKPTLGDNVASSISAGDGMANTFFHGGDPTIPENIT